MLFVVETFRCYTLKNPTSESKFPVINFLFLIANTVESSRYVQLIMVIWKRY